MKQMHCIAQHTLCTLILFSFQRNLTRFLKSHCHPGFFAHRGEGKHNNTTQLACWKGKKGEEAMVNFYRSLEKGYENDRKYPDLAAKFHWNSCRVFASSWQPHCIDTDKCVWFLFCLLHCIATINADSHAVTHCIISALAIVHWDMLN